MHNAIRFNGIGCWLSWLSQNHLAFLRRPLLRQRARRTSLELILHICLLHAEQHEPSFLIRHDDLRSERRLHTCRLQECLDKRRRR